MLEPIRHILSQQRIILASGSPRRSEILKMIGLKFEVHTSNFEENLDKSSFSHPCEYVKENAKQKAIEVWNRLKLPDNKDGLHQNEASSPSSSCNPPDLVIGADTVVTLYDEIMEKPKDEEDAFDMLKKLSGLKHTVFTGVALVTKPKQLPHVQQRHSLNLSNSQPSSLESQDFDQRASGAQSLQYHMLHGNLCNTETKDYVVTTFHESTDVTMAELNDDIIKGYIATGEPFDKAGAYAIQCNGATLIEQIKGDFYNVVGMPLHRLCRELYILHSDL
uniref:N-acetylserotonin O-methyltransferase-like protein n=1 Tax=Aceria tosichella TaxID=561515 RepID=A0A6G1S424_9ACAR